MLTRNAQSIISSYFDCSIAILINKSNSFNKKVRVAEINKYLKFSFKITSRFNTNIRAHCAMYRICRKNCFYLKTV